MTVHKDVDALLKPALQIICNLKLVEHLRCDVAPELGLAVIEYEDGTTVDPFDRNNGKSISQAEQVIAKNHLAIHDLTQKAITAEITLKEVLRALRDTIVSAIQNRASIPNAAQAYDAAKLAVEDLELDRLHEQRYSLTPGEERVLAAIRELSEKNISPSAEEVATHADYSARQAKDIIKTLKEKRAIKTGSNGQGLKPAK